MMLCSAEFSLCLLYFTMGSRGMVSPIYKACKHRQSLDIAFTNSVPGKTAAVTRRHVTRDIRVTWRDVAAVLLLASSGEDEAGMRMGGAGWRPRGRPLCAH